LKAKLYEKNCNKIVVWDLTKYKHIRRCEKTCFKAQWKVFGYVYFKMWAPTEELYKFNMMSFGDNGRYSDERSLTEFQGH